MSAPLLMLAALAVEVTLGWPDALYRRIGHPVVWFGALVSRADRWLNRPGTIRPVRILAGGFAAVLLIAVAAATGLLIEAFLPAGPLGWAAAAMIASSLLAARSLSQHVGAVAEAFDERGTAAARICVARIVGRRTEEMDEPAIVRAALESLAENTSDGVTAPLFWGALFGFPGLFAYKAINTLDSMIGHRTSRHEAFGKVAARLDDLANWLPARITGMIFLLMAGSGTALRVMMRDAPRHRSPNAGWPEAAMAGALHVRLSGPRRYESRMSDDPWLNAGRPDPRTPDIARGLALYRKALAASAVLLGLVGLLAS